MAKLNSSQVLILQALTKADKPLTREQIEAKSAGAAVNAGNIGPVFKEVLENYPDSLYGLGFVRPEKAEDGTVTWNATAKGKAASAKVKTRKRNGIQRVPNGTIDPVVKKFKPTRTYGFELYTDDDLKEIRAACGDEHKDVPLTDLQAQIIARRKQGAYADEAATVGKAVARVLREFGPDGTVLKNLLKPDQCNRLKGLVKS